MATIRIDDHRDDPAARAPHRGFSRCDRARRPGPDGRRRPLQVTVSSPRFAGLSLVEQHQLVYAALERPLADGTIHELRISTKGP